MRDPYIGVTGFTKPEEVLAALNAFPRDSKRKLMVGVLASYKSLRGIEMKPMRAGRTPKPELIKDIFLGDARALNLVHYNTEQGEEDSILKDLRAARVFAGDNFDGFQLNVTWPSVSFLEYYRIGSARCFRLVLQLGHKAVSTAGGTPAGVVLSSKTTSAL